MSLWVITAVCLLVRKFIETKSTIKFLVCVYMFEYKADSDGEKLQILMLHTQILPWQHKWSL